VYDKDQHTFTFSKVKSLREETGFPFSLAFGRS
jgi:hypothetical protein